MSPDEAEARAVLRALGKTAPADYNAIECRALVLTHMFGEAVFDVVAEAPRVSSTEAANMIAGAYRLVLALARRT